MGLSATLALATVVWVASAAATSLIVSGLWLVVKRRLRRLQPATRVRTLSVITVAPCVIATLLTLLCFAPGILGWLGFLEDHCRLHPDHPHLCLIHPTAAFTPVLMVILVLVVCALVAKSLAEGARLLRSLDQARHLRGVATAALAPGVWLVASDRAFAVTSGFIRPSIFVSTALADALPASRLEVVLAHERAHARRRDPLLRLAAHALSFPLPPPLRREMLESLATAVEQTCDDVAAERAADRLLVAEVILAVERLASGTRPDPAAAPGFGGHSVRDRVHNLIEAQPEKAAPDFVWWVVAIAISAVVAFSGSFHHGVEHWLNLLHLTH